MRFPALHRLSAAAAAAALLLALSACASSPAPSGTTESGTATSAATGSGAAGTHGSGASAGSLPSAHVHGLAVDATTGRVLLATHEGLFDMSTRPATKIGPTNDLMGFTAAPGTGVFYASGHPGKDSTMSNPMGLIRSSDGGKTWAEISRQGESDFHALTVTKSGIVAFDGQLWVSPDEKTWTTAAAGFAPAVLAGNPGTNTVLATLPEGLQRSTDGGRTWKAVPSSPVIQFATFASDKEAVGVEPNGTVHYSSDSGITWTSKGKITADVQAVAAAKDSAGKLQVWAATADELIVSSDGGATFHPAAAD
ncbi:F510_1955 family glycosylhydrolase [Arthrobacter sp. D1-17]